MNYWYNGWTNERHDGQIHWFHDIIAESDEEAERIIEEKNQKEAVAVSGRPWQRWFYELHRDEKGTPISYADVDRNPKEEPLDMSRFTTNITYHSDYPPLMKPYSPEVYKDGKHYWSGEGQKTREEAEDVCRDRITRIEEGRETETATFMVKFTLEQNGERDFCDVLDVFFKYLYPCRISGIDIVGMEIVDEKP